jgi:hypothetical protein
MAASDIVDDRHHERRANSREVALDLVARFMRTNRPYARRQHRARVQRLHHSHDCDAGFALPCDDRAVNRRGAAITRQERGMNVEEAEPRQLEQRFRQQLSVRSDDAEIGPKLRQRGQKRGVSQALGLENGQAAGRGARLYRRVNRSLAATSRAIGLGDDGDDQVPRGEERVEGRHGELGRAEKDDAQLAGHYHLPARASFLIFRTMRSRLIPRSRSTKSRPSR